MSKTSTVLLVGVAALAAVAVASRKGFALSLGGTSPATTLPGTSAAGSNPTAGPAKPPAPSRVTDRDFFDAGVSITRDIINRWGLGAKPTTAK